MYFLVFKKIRTAKSTVRRSFSWNRVDEQGPRMSSKTTAFAGLGLSQSGDGAMNWAHSDKNTELGQINEAFCSSMGRN